MARVKILALDQRLLMGMFRGEHHYRIVSNSMPLDAKVVRVSQNFNNGDVELMIESRAFPQVPKGRRVEYFGTITPVAENTTCYSEPK